MHFDMDDIFGLEEMYGVVDPISSFGEANLTTLIYRF